MEKLDLRGVICPYNFVKTKLKLETLETGALLTVFLDDGEPIQNVPKSITNEGHQVLNKEKVGDYFKVVIQKEGVGWNGGR
ncbi:MAG: sulfurtransferase TusA family protein [Nitrospirales bacterium]